MTMFCGKILPPIVHPTKCCTNHTQQNFIQPHIYPSHTTNVNHQVIGHANYYPHTESFVNEVSNVNLGPVSGPVPGGMGGFGPGAMGPMGGPGPMPFGFPR